MNIDFKQVVAQPKIVHLFHHDQDFPITASTMWHATPQP
jgi:hypothetical protein